ncbi:hypothetical protein CARUB_v10012390mg [Capsella rubella]|uniref:Uncharacterized protein n=1 Tax=Capsella rubella TaxID=81985 RepID=R0GL69_9BRAS|nr:hypothetical protein CARUB_v10012390mg [Capsella rubella]
MESMSMTQRVVRFRQNKNLQQSRFSPYTKETTILTKQKEEAVRLGVELSLSVAEAMFLLSDDIHTMLVFCLWLVKYAGNESVNAHVLGRLLCVILYVFETYIKPKNGVYKHGGKSNQWELIVKSRKNFTFGIRELYRFVSILKNRDSSLDGDVVIKQSDFEHYKEELKKLEETLRSSKDVEVNGFAREAIKSNILYLWKSLFETSQPKVINPCSRIREMFRPLLNQVREEVCSSLIASLHI